MEYVYHEDYKGPRFTYGMRNRPFGFAHQPKGFVIGSNREHPGFNHGIIEYPAELPISEIISFELEPVIEWKVDGTTHEAVYRGQHMTIKTVMVGRNKDRPISVASIGEDVIATDDVAASLRRRLVREVLKRLSAGEAK